MSCLRLWFGILLLAVSFGATLAETRDMAYFDRLAGQLRDLVAQERYADARAVADAFERSTRETFGDDTIEHAAALNWQASLLQLTGGLDEAGRLFERVDAIYAHKLDPHHPDRANSLNNIGVHRHWTKQYEEAVSYFMRSLDIRERLQPRAPCQIAESLNNLGHTYPYLGRNAEARALLDRAAALVKEDPKSCPKLVVQILQNKASVLENLKEYRESEKVLLDLLAHEKAMDGSQLTMAAINNRIGIAETLQGDCDKAGRYFESALRLYRKAPQVPPLPFAASLHDFALNELICGRTEAAHKLLLETLAVRETNIGPRHHDVARTLSDIADLSARLGKQTEALGFLRRAASIMSASYDTRSDWVKLLYRRYAESLWATRATSRSERDTLAEAFEAAQRAMLKDTATTVERAARRLAEKDPRVGALLRESDDLIARRTGLEERLSEIFSRPVEQRSAADLALQQELDEIPARREKLNAELVAADSAVAALINPRPLALAQTQAALKPDEALLLIMPTYEEVFVFAVTAETARWARQPLTDKELQAEVRELRAGLDDSLAIERGKQRSFSLALAHRLYAQLFGGIDDAFREKTQLLVTTAGALEQLPLHVLVTDEAGAATRATGEAYKSAAWLVRRHAVTVLPAVANLASLRGATARRAERPFIAFANPLLDGNPKNPADVERARLARERTDCSHVPGNGPKVASLPSDSGGALRNLMPAAKLKAQPPLPETADEVCSVARSAKADEADIFLGARATETAIKELNANRSLARYRILEFATHAALAGEIDADAEPGLVLTPPQEPTAADDGYLSRSEILALELNADWVVLSACNTASAGAASAEGLSGLAQAFFHAGARALLVSHWYIDSLAATQIVTKTSQILEANASAGHAEALRGAMLDYLDTTKAVYAAPSYWAPFVVVGAGIREQAAPR